MKIKDILESGVEIDGNKFLGVTDENKQRLETMLSNATDMKQQYSAQLVSMKDQVSLAENDINNRVLQNNNTTITLDHKGRVSSYTVDDNTRVFRTQKRPFLVDQEANIYNSVSGLKDTNIDLALYSPRQTVTQMGEVYQSYWRPDIHHLQTIEDDAERQQVKTQEKALSEYLKGKGIEDAISIPPTINDERRSGMLIEDHDIDQKSTSLINIPINTDNATAMERINGGVANIDLASGDSGSMTIGGVSPSAFFASVAHPKLAVQRNSLQEEGLGHTLDFPINQHNAPLMAV